MENNKKGKPLSLTIIGWIFITIAGLMLISGTLDLVSFDQYGSIKMANVSPSIKETPAVFRLILDQYQQNFMLATLGQVIFSGFMLVSGVFFLKLHSWARTALEGMSWLGLVYISAVEIFYITSWVGFMSGPAVDGVSRAAVTLMLLGVVLGTALWGVLLAVILRNLRGGVIRTALERAVQDNVKLSYN